MKVESVLAPGVYRMDNGSYRVVARVGTVKQDHRQRRSGFRLARHSE